VTATASRPETEAWCRELGADHVVDHRQPLPPQLQKLGIGGFDFIANFSNTDAYWNFMADWIKPQGIIGSIVENTQPLDLNLLKSKSAAFVWEFMFTRSMFETPDMQAHGQLLNQIANLIDGGQIRCNLKETLHPINAANLRAAHVRLESGSMIGKLALSGW
jgi:NADPH:quinone reductase-like Zn-dependent oxidoreductase